MVYKLVVIYLSENLTKLELNVFYNLRKPTKIQDTMPKLIITIVTLPFGIPTMQCSFVITLCLGDTSHTTVVSFNPCFRRIIATWP
jgi:hypothetical protein